MRFSWKVLIALLSFSISVSSAEEIIQKQSATEYENDIKQLQQVSKSTINDIEIIRRDQINYRLEKDLLKEAYASNLESINISITIVLGVIGVLGYLGIRSIKDVKADYVTELDGLKKLKIGFENELQILSNKQKQFEGQVSELTKTNEEQNQRLKVLELIEKIGNLISTRHWQWAQEYITIGLNLDPKNLNLLSQKATCHAKLGEVTAAIEARKVLLELSPSNVIDVINLLEALALGNQWEEFNSLYAKFKAKVDESYGGNITVYLNAILNLFKANFDVAITELTNFIDNRAQVAEPLLGNWQFEEANVVVDKLPESRQKKLLISTIQYFQGNIDSNAFKTILKESV